MNDLRKAAEQALEALEKCQVEFQSFYPRLDAQGMCKVTDEAMDALEAALAQPDPLEVRQGWEYMREKGLLQETWNEHPIDTDTTRGPVLMTVGDTLARAGFIKQPKPLTDDEVYALVDATIEDGRCEFARAIEKAHGIGGEV